MPELSAFEVEIAMGKLKRHKSPGIDQIPAELIKAGVEKSALRSINLLILFRIRRNFLRSERSRSLYLSIRTVIKQIVVNTGAYRFCQLPTKFYPTLCCQS